MREMLPRLSLAIPICALLFSTAANAAAVLALSLENLKERSDIIVRGVATDVETHRDLRGAIVRTVSYKPLEYLKGSGKQEIRIRLQGGELDGLGRMVPGEVDLKVGDETVLFLENKRNQADVFRIVGLCQGRFNVVRNSADNSLYVSRPLADINMVGKPTKDSLNLGQNEAPFYMRLSEFVEAVGEISNRL